MQVLHCPEQHKGNRVKADAAPTAAPAKDSSQQDEKGGGKAAAIQLQSRLKKVMCDNLCLSSEDVDKLFDEAKSQRAQKKGVGIKQDSFCGFN